MEIDQRFAALMDEITKQEELIENYANKLEEAGNIDPSIEDYLQNTREELRLKKQKLIQEFQPKQADEKKRLSIINLKDGDDSPRVKLTKNTPKASSSRAEKFPFYSVHKIEIEKNPDSLKDNLGSSKKNLPEQIFKKKSGSSRGNSPSAFRYSPQTSPLENKRRIENIENPDPEISSTECSLTNVDKLNDLGSIEYSEAYRQYQQMRELRNKAHEKMLKLKEKMLYEKEAQLKAMKHYIDSKSITIKRGNTNESDYWNDLDFDCSRNKVFDFKLPASPGKIFKKTGLNSTSSKNDKIVKYI
jgi:hypothetical protein